MYQKIGGMINDLFTFSLFVYFSLIISGVIKQKKPIKLFEENAILFKILIYGGTILFGALCISKLLS